MGTIQYLILLTIIPLHTGIFPDHLKMAVVRPLYKKGDKFEISNYRPISLIPTFAKIFEKAMYSRLSQHLQTNNILAPEQYTFMKDKSTENAAFRLTDSVLKSLNQKLCVGGMFCKLSKASDCVNHKILLTKLHFCGIQGITIDWFRSYLTNRKQKVEIKSPNSAHNLVSEWGILKHGVPQVSILQALLFLVYINYLPLQKNSLAEPISFADDTSVRISNESFIDFSTSANQVLAHMTEWFSANKLVLNLEKTNIMKFVTINLPYCALTVSYKNKCIEEAVNVKFLGIQIDSHLTWRNHIDQIIPKLSIACYMVRQMYHICNNDMPRSIYFVYFHSIASYEIILWGTSSYSRKIFTLQKRIIRTMMGAHLSTSCREVLKKLEILTIPSIYIYIYTHTHTHTY